MKQVFKLLNKSSLVVLLLLFVGTVMATTPGKREFSKTINKQFNINADGIVNLNNKYGQIDIKTWEQNSVRISVRIVVNASSESAATTQFDLIDIHFSDSGNEVSATTEIESKKSNWWSWGDSCEDFSINYDVFMPVSANINVVAKYCDVFVVATTGQADMNVKYGNFKIDALGEDSEVVLAYGNGSINRVRDLDVDLSYGNLDVVEASDINMDIRYGNLTVEQAGDIICDSKYSNFKLGEVREFRNEGKYDNIEIESVEELVCDTHYTSIKVGQLIRRMNLDMSYGSAKTMSIASGFDEINMNGNYTDFKMYLDSNASCNVDIEANHAGVRIPSNANKTFDAQDGSSQEVRATIGRSGGLIKASLRYGGITVGRN